MTVIELYDENVKLKQENEKLRELVNKAIPFVIEQGFFADRTGHYWSIQIKEWIEKAQAILNKEK